MPCRALEAPTLLKVSITMKSEDIVIADKKRAEGPQRRASVSARVAQLCTVASVMSGGEVNF